MLNLNENLMYQSWKIPYWLSTRFQAVNYILLNTFSIQQLLAVCGIVSIFFNYPSQRKDVSNSVLQRRNQHFPCVGKVRGSFTVRHKARVGISKT